MVYTIRVDEGLKGNFAKPLVIITMLGNLKADVSSGNVKRLSTTDVNPNLEIGSDYVLFTTAPSAVGLSTTVGLGQGLFRIFSNVDKLEMATNALDNQ